MKFSVTAVAVNTQVFPPTFSAPRTEIVDPDVNQHFAECSTIRDIEFAYEKFWNYPNGPDLLQNPCEKIKVISVTGFTS